MHKLKFLLKLRHDLRLHINQGNDEISPELILKQRKRLQVIFSQRKAAVIMINLNC